jgi:hypothetical protein
MIIMMFSQWITLKHKIVIGIKFPVHLLRKGLVKNVLSFLRINYIIK